MVLSFTSHLRYRMEWLGKHFILRSKNLEYGTCRKVKKNHICLLSKKKLRNGSQKTARVEYVKSTYQV